MTQWIRQCVHQNTIHADDVLERRHTSSVFVYDILRTGLNVCMPDDTPYRLHVYIVTYYTLWSVACTIDYTLDR